MPRFQLDDGMLAHHVEALVQILVEGGDRADPSEYFLGLYAGYLDCIAHTFGEDAAKVCDRACEVIYAARPDEEGE